MVGRKGKKCGEKELEEECGEESVNKCGREGVSVRGIKWVGGEDVVWWGDEGGAWREDGEGGVRRKRVRVECNVGGEGRASWGKGGVGTWQ